MIYGYISHLSFCYTKTTVIYVSIEAFQNNAQYFQCLVHIKPMLGGPGGHQALKIVHIVPKSVS